MNKQCKTCGSNVPYDAKFCQMCGCSDFIINNPNQQTDINNNSNLYQQNYYQNQYNQSPSVNQTWQPPVPQNKPKKKKTGLIIGIIAATLVILAVIGMLAEKAFQEQGYGDNNDDYSLNVGDNINSSDASSSYDEPEKVYYTKGTFDGTVYVNEWADIKFALPEGFSNADSATYSAAENSNTECGAYFIADDTMSLIYICYEKLPTLPIYDEEEYLDAALKALKGVSGVTYLMPNTYSTATIGDYAYAKAECEFNNGNGDFSNTIYVRKLDGYMVFISAIGINPESNDALVSNITTVN